MEIIIVVIIVVLLLVATVSVGLCWGTLDANKLLFKKNKAANEEIIRLQHQNYCLEAEIKALKNNLEYKAKAIEERPAANKNCICPYTKEIACCLECSSSNECMFDCGEDAKKCDRQKEGGSI